MVKVRELRSDPRRERPAAATTANELGEFKLVAVAAGDHTLTLRPVQENSTIDTLRLN